MSLFTKQDIQKRVSFNGRPLFLSEFDWDKKTKTFSSEKNNLFIQFSDLDGCTLNTGSHCILNTGNDFNIKTGSFCIINTGNDCTIKTDDACLFKTGSGCVVKTRYSLLFGNSSYCTFRED